MSRKYFLYIWIPKYKCYYPVKIYSSKAAALNAVKNKYNYTTAFKLERLDKYDRWHHDKIIYYTAIEDEHGNQCTENGFYIEKEVSN